MHTLAFLDPGHFHAALTLRERNPSVNDEIMVYAPPGRELDDFLGLVDAFNKRAERPTGWRATVRAGERSLERLLDERRGDAVVLAGRNDRKMALARRLHDAGFAVLADKPWIVRPDAVSDVRHVLSGGAVAVEIMTGRHEITSIIAERLVADRDVFGEFEVDHVGGPEGRADAPDMAPHTPQRSEHAGVAGRAPRPPLARTGTAGPAIRLTSIHHLEKVVNGAPLRRPPWYFDLRVQGDGLADIPTHLVAQAQRLLASRGRPTDRDLELVAARRWATPVPRALFHRVTGLDAFPVELRDHVDGDTLAYFSNAELSFRLRGVSVVVATRWDLTEPPGGGDAHSAVVRGTRSQLRIEQGPETGFRRRLFVEPRRDLSGVGAALSHALATWPAALSGISAVATPDGFELAIPDRLRTGHENHFPLVLDEFIRTIDEGAWPDDRAADTLAKYELLARAARRA